MHYFKSLFPQSLKNLYHLAQAVLANVLYGFPSRKLKVIGVTGTDGKTTTVQMIAKIFEEAGKKIAVASTINFRINGKEEKKVSHFTTESSFAVQKFARKAVSEGCEYLVLETSSHSLDQHRVWGVNYITAVITNVTREHLDYHKTMEKYRKAKRKLFEMVSKNHGNIVVNLDMEKPEEYLVYAKGKTYGYTCHSERSEESRDSSLTLGITSFIKAENIELDIQDTRFKIQDTNFVLNLPGIFNAENALAATCVALGEGIDLETIKVALQKIKGVSGRLEAVKNDLGLHIIVDYAVTPHALENLYSFLQSIKKPTSKIIAVFGSCGDRDRGKRPIMGEIVSKYADQIILTNEEPYHEDPQKIVDEIAVGIKDKKEGEYYFKIIDRKGAIAKAISMAKQDDIIVVTGMGAQDSMIIGYKKIPWNDRNVIEELLEEMKSGSKGSTF